MRRRRRSPPAGICRGRRKGVPCRLAWSDHGAARTLGGIQGDAIYSRVAATGHSYDLGPSSGRDLDCWCRRFACRSGDTSRRNRCRDTPFAVCGRAAFNQHPATQDGWQLPDDSTACQGRAQQWKAEIGNIEGLRLAADIVERAVETRQPVRRP
jgi:hypothetical protein